MYSNSFYGLFLGFGLICAGIGAAIFAVLFWLIPWLWTLVKPWLHAVTG